MSKRLTGHMVAANQLVIADGDHAVGIIGAPVMVANIARGAGIDVPATFPQSAPVGPPAPPPVPAGQIATKVAPLVAPAIDWSKVRDYATPLPTAGSPVGSARVGAMAAGLVGNSQFGAVGPPSAPAAAGGMPPPLLPPTVDWKALRAGG